MMAGKKKCSKASAENRGGNRVLYVITGGSGSGKSEYAEDLAVSMGKLPRIYLATMQIWDDEGKKRVLRHKKQRAQKGFETVERFTELEEYHFQSAADGRDRAGVILLECMSNLAANEFYRQEEGAFERIAAAIKCLQKQCCDLIIVTNEIFSDGVSYDPESERYIRLLGRINRMLGRNADFLTEVVCGIPVVIKERREMA